MLCLYDVYTLVKEAVRIAEMTGASVQISHLVYQVGMGMMTQTLEVIDRSVRDGYDVMADSGLNHAFATFIGSPVCDQGCLEKWGCSYSDLKIISFTMDCNFTFWHRKCLDY